MLHVKFYIYFLILLMLTLFSHRLIPNSQFNDKMTCEATTKGKNRNKQKSDKNFE